MGTCLSLDQEELKARARSDDIDRQITNWAKEDKHAVKLLLLGFKIVAKTKQLVSLEAVQEEEVPALHLWIVWNQHPHTFDNKNALLVCISPTDQHMEDFWSLVEEQHITTVINMSMPGSPLKNIQLLGRNGSGETGKFSVKYKQEKEKKGFVERSISFCDENHEDEGGLTTIKEFQLISWPERDDLPTNMQPCFDMIEEILKWQPDLTDRTGYTRSGLIAVILNEIQRIKSERGQINIVESVKTMKTRCRDVIHSKEQYRFCFEILLLYIKNTGFYQNL